MITNVHGKTGVGKSAFLAHLGIERMTVKARDYIIPARKEIMQLNHSGYNLTMPEKHLVYSDFDIVARVEGYSPRVSYETNGYRLGLPAEGFDAQFFPPYSTLIFDEAQKYWNSRKSTGKESLPDNVSRFFEYHRHDDLDIIYASQRPGLVDRNIRDLCKQFIEILSIQCQYGKGGEIVGVAWKCLEFFDIYELENYMTTGKKSGGKATKYYHEGNIFKAYNSKNFKAAFYNKREKQDFDMTSSEISVHGKQVLTRDYIRRFNEKNKYIKEDTDE